MKNLIHLVMVYQKSGQFRVECPEYKVLAYGQNIPEMFEILGERLNEAISKEENPAMVICENAAFCNSTGCLHKMSHEEQAFEGFPCTIGGVCPHIGVSIKCKEVKDDG